MHVPQTTLGDGDLLVFATDGISPSFFDALRGRATVACLADHILTAHGRQDDDAPCSPPNTGGRRRPVDS